MASEVNIHLRARQSDRDLIDAAANIAGTNRTQFMLASAIREAQNVLLDQTAIQLGATDYASLQGWLDGAPSASEHEGMTRLAKAGIAWSDG